MDTWNTVASLATILSLLLYLSNKNSPLRQLSFPITAWIIGFAIGRNGSSFSPATGLLIQDPYLLVILLITFALFGLVIYLVESTKLDVKISFIFLVFLLTIAFPQLIKSYNNIAPMVATQDYLTLAKMKESSGSTEEAIKYLKIYKGRIGRSDIETQIGQKIETLKARQFKQDFIK
jgi:hypothetical protein